jgi:hypothetical protein
MSLAEQVLVERADKMVPAEYQAPLRGGTTWTEQFHASPIRMVRDWVSHFTGDALVEAWKNTRLDKRILE